ncbi:MAG: undecaprenyldiphospho-muramoylpentapeptide beta-N-acetylglucosaminyltransferase [Oscillospiraceae bacterium]|nr:undecaprenyldiphospho-muramoylpentapeptide beta-N-acetylglucosaminyltransferase [Oscillospiraceae bacterium]
MKVLFAAGGTAGHINPAISIAKYIEKRIKDVEIAFVGTEKGMENTLVKNQGYKFFSIKIKGFQRKLTIKNIINNIDVLRCIAVSNYMSKKIISSFKPDIVIGTGGYVSGPVVMTASRMGIKTCIHEQNAFAGITNKILSKKVDIVFSAVSDCNKHFKNSKKIVVCGNPIREEIVIKTKLEAKKELGLDNKFCILSFGGSLGATKINEIAIDLIKWNQDVNIVNHIHGFGKIRKKEFEEMMHKNNINKDVINGIIVKEYIDNMELCLSAADLVICRSGALTISEIQCMGKASILIPSPHVAENHQYHNGMVLVNNKAAILIEEKNYKREDFIKLLLNLIGDKRKIEAMESNVIKMGIKSANEDIYDEIIKILY